MSKLAKKVLVIGALTPGSKTSVERALELIGRRRARYVDEETIELIAADSGDSGDTRSQKHSPYLSEVVPWRPTIDPHQTFLHYPQRDQSSVRAKWAA